MLTPSVCICLFKRPNCVLPGGKQKVLLSVISPSINKWLNSLGRQGCSWEEAGRPIGKPVLPCCELDTHHISK